MLAMMKNNLNQDEVFKLQQLLLDWFIENHRDFPWRESRNPYYILIAEKLLQQTAVGERVITAYSTIISLCPTLQSLSQAKEEDLSQIVEPLGFHYRARELIKLARVIETEYYGELPKDYSKLIALPGIGEYTARAVLSFAYEQDIAIIDTNVARFLFRVFGIDSPMPSNPARNKLLENLATLVLPNGKSRNFNLAILDLCAAICRPQNPKCVICPVNAICNLGITG